MRIYNPFVPITVIVGLEGAGKTTLLNKLKTGGFQKNISPTLGFHFESLSYQGRRFDIIDLGGQTAFRKAIWKKFVTNCHACLFLFDRSDREKITVAKDWLWRVIEWLPKDIIFAFFANKSDLPDIIPLEDIITHLELPKLSEHLISYQIFETSSKTALNIAESWQWITNELIHKQQYFRPFELYQIGFYTEDFQRVHYIYFGDKSKKEYFTKMAKVVEEYSEHLTEGIDEIHLDDIKIIFIQRGLHHGVFYTHKETELTYARAVFFPIMIEVQNRLKTGKKIDKAFVQGIIKATRKFRLT